jgi:fructuronate reductase
VHGFLAEAISRRRAAEPGLYHPLLRQSSGKRRNTEATACRFRQLRGAEFGRFVEEEIAFPSSMVDRIVPATTDEDRARIGQALGVADAWPVTTEPFLQWVIEDNFPAAGRTGTVSASMVRMWPRSRI